MTVTPLELAKVAARAADSKKAEDVTCLDLSSMTDVCDYFLICTGANARQVDAIVDEVREKVSASCGVSPISCEGREGLSWVLVDYGSVVVHDIPDNVVAVGNPCRPIRPITAADAALYGAGGI